MEELVRHNLQIFTMDLCERHPGNGNLMSETLENIHLMTKKGIKSSKYKAILQLNFFLANGNFCPLLQKFATSLGPDKDLN